MMVDKEAVQGEQETYAVRLWSKHKANGCFLFVRSSPRRATGSHEEVDDGLDFIATVAQLEPFDHLRKIVECFS